MKTRVCLPQNSRQWSAACSSCWQSQMLQFTQMLGLPHTMVPFSVFCCPGSMPLNLLMPKTTNPFDAGCWPNMLLSWTRWFMCHITFPVEQQKSVTWYLSGCSTTGLSVEIVLAEQGEETTQSCTLQHGKFEALSEYIYLHSCFHSDLAAKSWLFLWRGSFTPTFLPGKASHYC